jgi:large subunit ribosomal protein L30
MKENQAEATIKIKLIGSPICCPEKHKVIVRSLGLKKINRIVVRPDNAAFRGMVLKIPHLLAIVTEPPPSGSEKSHGTATVRKRK